MKIKNISKSNLSGAIHHYFLNKKNSAGFTLIELLVVIAIIGLLSSVVFVGLSSARTKSRDAKRVADMNQLAKAMELFFSNNNSYPTTTGAVAVTTYGVLTGSSTDCVSGTAGCVNYLIPNVLVKVPLAPKPADVGSDALADCSRAYAGNIANDYLFAGTGGTATAGSYTMTFCISNQVGAFSPGVHTMTPASFQ